MRIFTIVFAAILGVALAGPVEVSKLKQSLEARDVATRNPALEEAILGILEELRNLMINGSDDVPVLDPFQLDELHLDGDMAADIIDLPDSHITLKDISMVNLSTFEINELTVEHINIIIQRYRITIDGKIPDLEISTNNYDLNINVFGGNIFGNGNMKVNIINPRIHGYIVVRLSIIGGIQLTIEECRLGFTLDDFEAHITGLMGNNVISDFVSAFLRNLIPEMVEFFEEDITEALSTAVQTIGNDILRDLDIGSIFPLKAFEHQ